ncbi:MAG TPA: VanZ family protein [Oligoflexia bacterium]|nr:VanZ family protein [Oligoflexia bacterium]HMP49723.1 VanZ family protein [Oligoflexia bacterium]
MLSNYSIVALGVLIPGFSIFGLDLLITYQTNPVLGTLLISPLCVILLGTIISLNLSPKETLILFVLQAFVYLLMAQLPREYLHIYTFSVLGAHLQSRLPKLFLVNLITGAIISFFDELIQLYVPNRFFDVNDIFLNFFSYLIGVIIIRIPVSTRSDI